MNRWVTLAFLAVGLLSVAQAQSHVANNDDLKKELAAKTAESKALEEKARDVTEKLGDLAKSGNLPTSDDALALMKKMVEELSDIRDQLRHQDAEIATLYKATGIPQPTEDDAQKAPKKPTMDSRLSALERIHISGFEQYQFRNSGQPGSEQSAFSSKRTRLNLEVLPDNKNVGFKASFDLAGGKDTNGYITKDAFIRYFGDIPSTRQKVEVMAGQFTMPLGYDLQRSDTDREEPERATYNRTLINGERGRGVNVALPLSDGVTLQGGVFNALSTEDPEQSGYSVGPSGRLVGTAGLKRTQTFTNKNQTKTTFEYGLSGLIGRRPSFTSAPGSTSPEVDRKLGYLHANFLNLFGKGIDWRNELMIGKDRVPSSTGNAANVATNMSGWQSALGVRFGNIHRLDLRVQQFNPNLNVSNKTQTMVGLTYGMYFNNNYRLMLTRERVYDGALSPSQYNITTIRVQFKF